MPRDGSSNYSKPAGTTAVANTTIESAAYNTLMDDFVTLANELRPIAKGGTGAASQGAAQVSLNIRPAPYASRAAAELATPHSSVNTISYYQDGVIYDFVRDAGGTALTTFDSATWSPANEATVVHFGALGDWDGSTGTDDTTAVDAALDWWSAGERHLHFPDGWYYYDGQKDVDCGDTKWGTITCDGRIWFADAGEVTGNPIAWTIHNLENLDLQLRIHGGGALGDFSVRSPNDGGTTAVKIHYLRWGKIDIESMDYAGRVLHTTAEDTAGAARARNMNIHIVSGNRTTNPENVRCGQPIYADSNACTQTGSWGKFTWRGEGTEYGPVFERLNDIRIPDLESGLFATAGMEFRGCVVVHIDSIYTGQSDNSSASGVSFITSSAGRKCSNVTIGIARHLTATSGIYAEDFDATNPGLVIGSIAVTASESALHINDMPSVRVGAISASDVDNIVKVEGANGDIRLHFANSDTVAEDAFYADSAATWDQLTLSGTLDAGTATFSLVNLGSANNTTFLDGLHLSNSDVAQLISIGFAGQNKVRLTNGSVAIGGSTTVFNSPRRAEYISGVRGLQTLSQGQGTIASGNTSVAVTHGLDVTPQFVTATGLHSELASIYATTITATQITFAVPSATTGDRNFYWQANAVLLRDDVSA